MAYNCAFIFYQARVESISWKSNSFADADKKFYVKNDSFAQNEKHENRSHLNCK